MTLKVRLLVLSLVQSHCTFPGEPLTIQVTGPPGVLALVSVAAPGLRASLCRGHWGRECRVKETLFSELGRQFLKESFIFHGSYFGKEIWRVTIHVNCSLGFKLTHAFCRLLFPAQEDGCSLRSWFGKGKTVIKLFVKRERVPRLVAAPVPADTRSSQSPGVSQPLCRRYLGPSGSGRPTFPALGISLINSLLFRRYKFCSGVEGEVK